MRPTPVEKGGNSGRPDIAPLPSSMTETLQGLMRAVVTSGTGRALAAVPGDPVYGKDRHRGVRQRWLSEQPMRSGESAGSSPHLVGRGGRPRWR
jgi:hypothetical protein